MEEIAAKYKMGRTTISKILKNNSIKIKSYRVRGEKREEIANDIRTGMCLSDIEKKHNVSFTLIEDIKKENGLTIVGDYKKQRERNKNILHDWHDGLDRNELCEKYKLGKARITEIIVDEIEIQNGEQNDIDVETKQSTVG
jgi:Mor family transcriptional regulator